MAEGEQIGKKPMNQARKFLNGSASKYQKRQFYGRGPTKLKHGREVKANGTNGS